MHYSSHPCIHPPPTISSSGHPASQTCIHSSIHLSNPSLCPSIRPSVSTRLYTHVHTYVYTHIRTCGTTYIHSLHRYIHPCMYARTYTYLHTCLHDRRVDWHTYLRIDWHNVLTYILYTHFHYTYRFIWLHSYSCILQCLPLSISIDPSYSVFMYIYTFCMFMCL